MDSGTITGGNLCRLVGIMAVAVGVAWALQVIGLSADGSVLGKLMWVLGAAAISGAGVGLIVAAGGLPDAEGDPSQA